MVATNSSMGVWEIMECDEQYDAQLLDFIETKYGVITSNFGDEDWIIKDLADGICKCYTNQYSIDKFNKKKFSKESFISKLFR